MKIKAFFALLLAGLLSMSAMAATFTDAEGREVAVENPQRVVSLHASYADAWMTAGGTLVGVPENAFEFSEQLRGSGAQSLGSHDEPNMELLFSLEPDFVILSADNENHQAVAEVLEQAGVPCAFFAATDWRDYMDMMRLFTDVTGRGDLYQAQVETVQQPIEACIAEAEAMENYGRTTALLLRAYSSGVRAKGSRSNVAGAIMSDMGFVNIADSDQTLLENLSLEQILLDDPDYIFIVTMGGNTDAAMQSLAELLTDNPAWNTLTAVKENRCIVLDRALFHLHPNARWAESYEFMLSLLREQGQ